MIRFGLLIIPFIAAMLLLNEESIMVTASLEYIAAPLSDTLLPSNLEFIIVKLPFLTLIAPPEAELWPFIKFKFSIIRFAPFTTLNIRALDFASMVLLFPKW